ncbi:MAG: hypothetical protein V3S09_06965, partial [Candidatus Bathyarchaeia archaeon]
SMFFLTVDRDEQGEDFDVHVYFFTHLEPSYDSNQYPSNFGIIDILRGDLKICKAHQEKDNK